MNHPQQLGRYRITEVLGQGAMGVVYKGFDPGIGRVVALKTIRTQLLDNTEARATMVARFRNEAQAAGRLMHPGIVAVHDYADEGEISFIAMEYVDGTPLSRVLGSHARFEEDDVLSLMAQLLDALEHAHAHGVWHRDIKPGNLILARDGRLKVADFGIARIDSVVLTQVTSVVGTPGYMAPEQFTGKGIDHRADLWAAGVLLYQLIVGQAPFSGTAESVMYRVVNEPVLPPSQASGLERLKPFDSVIEKALAKSAADRFDSAAAFRAALVAAAGRPAAPAVSGDTLVTVMVRPGAATAPPPSTASNWDRTLLAQVEATLARQIGPLAGVLVRRAAKDCSDLPSLYGRVAEQLTDPDIRAAFLAQVAAVPRTGTGTRPPATSPSLAANRPSDEFVAQCARLLVQHVGPIAPVLARRAAAKATDRASYLAALEAAVDDPAARAKLRAALDKLP